MSDVPGLINVKIGLFFKLIPVILNRTQQTNVITILIIPTFWGTQKVIFVSL